MQTEVAKPPQMKMSVKLIMPCLLYTSLAAGEYRSRAVAPCEPTNAAIGHHQTPGEILRLSRDLYGHAPPATLWSVGGENFGYQEGLSRRVRRALPRVIQELLHTIGAPCEPISAF